MTTVLRYLPVLTAGLLVVAALALAGCDDEDQAVESASGDTRSQDALAPASTPPDGEIVFSGPYTHENLSVFLIHGADTIEGDQFLTLEQALADEVLVIEETSSVNELVIENCGDAPVFMQAGEIIRGGKQDRMLRFDILLRGNSGRRPLSVFCVESGRWHARAGEDVAGFASSRNMAPDAMRMAAVRDGDQSVVWAGVAANQDALIETTGQAVRSTLSPTSMELTLDSDAVRQGLAEYTDVLRSAPEGRDNVVGYAVVVNGRVESVDIYGSSALFRQLWPKLLRNSALMALAESNEQVEPVEVAADDVQEFIDIAQQGRQASQDVSDTMRMGTIENDATFSYESSDGQTGIMHRALLRKR